VAVAVEVGVRVGVRVGVGVVMARGRRGVHGAIE
jgi:hypothetical protein